jgi:hypothetical protein
MLEKNVWPANPTTQPDAMPADAPKVDAMPAEALKVAPPKPFLSCQEGCGMPARWVLVRELRRADAPVSEALCDACLAKRVNSAR